MSNRRPSLTLQIAIAIVIYSVAFIYSLVIAPNLVKSKNKLSTKLNELHESCVIGCKPLNVCSLDTKGSSYYIGSTSNANKCIITFWSMTHLVMYSLLGYLCYDLFAYLFCISLLFEVFEQYMYNCQDYIFDPICNMLGLLIGCTLRELF